MWVAGVAGAGGRGREDPQWLANGGIVGGMVFPENSCSGDGGSPSHD